MFKQINRCFHEFSNKFALIDCLDGNVFIRRTFEEVKSEANALNAIVSKFPIGAAIAIRTEHKSCLLPVVYSLLEHKITFMLIEPGESIEQLTRVRLDALITCQAHGEESRQSRQKFNIQIIRTGLGCNYVFYKRKEIVEVTSFGGICYIIQTSGTMGRKKVVQVTESCIYSNITAFIELFNIQSSDVIYFGTPLTFDPAILELFLSFTTGACLLSTSKSIRNNPGQLIQSLFSRDIKAECVTFMQMCPSKFLQFSSTDIDYIMNKTSLRVLALGGEQFPEHILRKKLPCACKIFNCYGITEMSCWASVEELIQETELSLGTPLKDTSFYIEDNENFIHFNRDIKDCRGTLYIESVNRICYVDNCPDSRKCTGDVVQVKNARIFYVGRSDDVIKRFGKRVSLIEIEKSIYTVCNLLNSCICEENLLVSFMQIDNFHSTSLIFRTKAADKIRVKLINELPSHFVPDYIELIDRLPVNEANGKLDKHALKILAEYLIQQNNRIPNVGTLNLREVFKTLWEQYTGCSNNLDSLQNFWELGGNSIKAMQFAQIYERQTKSTLNRSLFDLNLTSALEVLQNAEGSTINAQTGNNNCMKIIWKSNLEACIDSSSTVTKFRNRVIVVIGNFAHIFAVFDARTGQELARITLPNVIESPATVNGNRIFVGCFDGKLYNLELSEINDEKYSIKIAWSFPSGDRLKCKPLLSQLSERIIFGSYDKVIYCLKQDRVLEWKTNVGDITNSEIKEFDKKLYLGCLQGSILCLNSINGSIVWRVKGKNPIFAPPACKEDKIVIFLDICGTLYCFNLISDQMLWMYEQDEPCSTRTFSSLCLYKNFVFHGTQDGKIVQFKCNAAECRLIDCYSLEISTKLAISPLSTTPLYISQKENDYLVTVTNQGQIVLSKIDIINGQVRLHQIGLIQLPGESFSSPISCLENEKRFYLGCRDNNIYCIEINQ